MLLKSRVCGILCLVFLATSVGTYIGDYADGHDGAGNDAVIEVTLTFALCSFGSFYVSALHSLLM